MCNSDIKLENVVFMRDNTAKLIDFGSAGELRDCPAFLNVGRLRGTPPYLAPECWNDIYSPASDMWALGVLLCNLLFFRPLFNYPTIDTLKSHVLAAGAVDPPTYLTKLFSIRTLSEEGTHFLSLLLAYESAKRITASNALLHPWIVNHMPHPRPPGSES